MSGEITQRTERNVFYDSILNQPISKTTTIYQTTIILNILSFHNVNPVCVIKSLFIVIIFIVIPIKTSFINNLILFDILKCVTILALIVLNPTKIDFKRDLPRFQSIKFIFQFFGDKADLLFSGELIIHFGVVLVLEWNVLFRETNLGLFSRFLLHAIIALQILNFHFAFLWCLRIFKIIECTGPEELSIILTVLILRIATYISFLVVLSLNDFFSYIYIFKEIFKNIFF